MGVGLAHLLNHLPDLPTLIAAEKFHYTVVETPSMCAAIEEPFREICTRHFGPRVFWRIRQELVPPGEDDTPITILNVASSLQYIDGWRKLLLAMGALRPRCIIISETPVTEAPTYARLQCNMPHRRLGTWVFNRSELVVALTDAGYTVRFQTVHDQPLSIAGEPPGYSSTMASFVADRRVA